MKAGIYTRLSVDRPGETARERQEADCRAYCASRGWEVAGVWTDLLSGFRDVGRPGFQDLLAAVDGGSIGAVVCWKLDRLTRKGIREVGPLLERFEKTETALVAVQDGIDTSSGAGEIILGVLAGVARQESQNVSVRTSRALQQRAEKGLPHGGGHRAFGYTRGGEALVEPEAALIRAAAADVLRGVPVGQIVARWSRQGVVTPAGNPWRSTSLRNMLCADRLEGVRSWKGKRFPGAFPAVLEPETAVAVRAVLRTGKGRPPARRYLLTGVVRCGRCSFPLYSRPRADGTRTYQCVNDPGGGRVGCGRLKVVAAWAEDCVEQAVLTVVEAGIAPPSAPEGLGELVAESELLKNRLEGLELAHFVEGSLSKERYGVLRAGLVEKLEDLGRRLGENQVQLEVAGWDVGLEWSALGIEERRRIVRAVFPEVRVLPAPGSGRTFRPERLRLVRPDGSEWRVVPGGGEEPDALVSGGMFFRL